MQSNKEFVKILGKGVYSTVHLVKYNESNDSSSSSCVAVKSSLAEDYDILKTELYILRKLRGCPRIVECFGDELEKGSNDDGNKVYNLLLEYASEGSLRAFMDRYRTLPDPMIRDFTRMILEGLASIHGHGYVHCDLKSDNLLIFPRGDSYELKISDFGLSLQVGKIPDHWTVDYPYVGTFNYMPPESFRDGVAKETLDLWSLGCLVLEMYTGVSPWKGIRSHVLEALLFDGKVPEIPETVPCDAKEFIETCLARNPEDRTSAYELLSHRFLNREKAYELLPRQFFTREDCCPR